MILSLEQKQYIREHPKASAYAMAKKFGCSENTIYHWLHKYHGDSFVAAKKAERERRCNVVRELYPSKSATEIANILGVTKATVNNIARRMGVRHTEETTLRIQRYCVSKTLEQPSREKRVKSLRKTLIVERWRAVNGMKQKTKRRFKTIPNKCLCAREYLVRKYNYFYDKDVGSLLTIFYDNETNRLSVEREEYYRERYGLQIQKA